MMGFIAFLITVCAVYLLFEFVRGLSKKRTIPQPDELTMQIADVSAAEQVEQQVQYKSTVKNTHWHRHTFERPRRKVKQ